MECNCADEAKHELDKENKKDEAIHFPVHVAVLGWSFALVFHKFGIVTSVDDDANNMGA